MGIIRILSDGEAKKIAAGEVVERPASVVKELVENSLDAGASKISLYIEKAGKSLIRVSDNGKGMLPVDARLCFENHATSKVRRLDDLEQIGSFGFRGEALAAISSVSEVCLQTRFGQAPEEQHETGVELKYIDGKFIEDQAIAMPVGTDIKIANLFYNTPVRKKFLKQDETEWNQIQNLFYSFCLSHTKIHFQLYRDNKMILNAPPVEQLRARVMQIWGHNFAQHLLDINTADQKNFQISGLVSDHNFWRYGRQQIFLFVNGRWVKNAELSKALMKGYKNVLPPARFPAALLFISINKSLVDINVHPRKEEVRFVKPLSVANAVQSAVSSALEQVVSKQLHGVSPFSPVAESTSPYETDPQTTPPPSNNVSFESLPTKAFDHAPVEEHCCEMPSQEEVVASSPFVEQESCVAEQKSCGRIIGQLLQTYIVVENEDGLLLVDQHAAHERILYEKYLKNFEHKDGTRLLFPEIIKVTDAQMKAVLKVREFFEKQGIEIEQIGDDDLAIKTSPPKVQGHSLRELIFETIEFIEQNEHLDEEVFRKKLNEHVHSQLACKMAIKAGDKLSHEMMENIITQLLQVDNRFICVHGRPTTWSVSKLDLEKRFRRK